MTAPVPDTPRPRSATFDDVDAAGDDASALSALVDGRGEALDRACARWRDDADARQAWHAYHLIGDVMRSEELARPAAGDAAFVAALRERLAAEPVPLAPSRRAPWRVPVALAAGVAVLGVLVAPMLGGTASDGGTLQLTADVAETAAASRLVTATDTGAEAAVVQARGPTAGGVGGPDAGAVSPLIRDPRLDEFLRAHRAAWGGIAVAAPGGMLRRVDDERAAGPAR